MADFSDYFSALDEDEFDELPVGVEEFVYSEKYLKFPKLSDNQLKIVKVGSQIYKEHTLKRLYGEKEGAKLWRNNKKELILALGKGCHSPHTNIYDPSSGKWRPLKDFSDLNNSVVGLHAGENKLVTQYATESFKEGYGEMMRVTTQMGFVEDVYIGHKYYAWRKKDFYNRNTLKKHSLPEYTRVDQLVPGDRVAVGLNFDVANPQSHNLDEVMLVGYWLGEGSMPQYRSETHYSGYYINVDFGAGAEESLARYLTACDRLGAEYTVTEHPTKKMTYVKHDSLNSKNKVLSEILTKYDLWGKRANDKTIPDAIWSLSNDDLCVFLAALWSTDGCVYHKKCKSHLPDMPIAEYTTISKDLADGVQKLLLRIGVPSSIKSRISKYIYKEERKEGQRAYYITVSSQDNFARFHKTIGVNLSDHKKIKSEEGIQLNPHAEMNYNRVDGDIYWDMIKSIESIGEGEYWTLTAADTHSYIGNGMISAQSGKDALSTIICAYVVYQLLCLKDPAEYYGKPSGDAIDIINVAINADQAANVFFKGFKTRVQKSPWFQGKYRALQKSIAFNKNVTVYSGNSEGEATEGYNILLAVLDEIDGFDEGSKEEGTPRANAMYNTLSATVSSRFDDTGKVLLLSFPRSREGFIMTKYKDAIAESETIQYEHTYKLDPDLPDGIPENEFEIQWNEDEILSYKFPEVWAMRKPTWKVNPTKTIDSFKRDFYKNPSDAAGRFACTPTDYTDGGWYPAKAKIDTAFSGPHALSDVTGRPEIVGVVDHTKEYYVHVDLARVQDNCAVAMAHVEKWQKTVFDANGEVSPNIIVDVVRYWKPDRERPVDFSDVRDFIISLKRHGYNIKLVTFDRWNSDLTIKQLNEYGLKAEKLSVGRDQYTDLATLMTEQRITGPDVPLLRKELKKLVVLPNGNVDHTNKSSKDLSDAVAGAAYNASVHTTRQGGIDVVTYAQMHEQRKQQLKREVENKVNDNIIRAPKTIPRDVEEFLAGIKLL